MFSHIASLYNLYVYFWRWALWKVFESGPRYGVVSFISASSYLRGPGFAGSCSSPPFARNLGLSRARY